ncbi:MAG: hypothetical protein WCB53_01880 [Terriglobales bacterium]
MAKDAVQHARALAAKRQNPEVRWRSVIAPTPVDAITIEVVSSPAPLDWGP